MISVKLLAKHVEKLAVDNAPGILTGVGVVGTLTTAYLTCKATLQATRHVDAEMDRRTKEYPIEQSTELSKIDTVKLIWVEFLPPMGAAAVTVAAIICANRVSAKRAAALMAAYSLSEGKFAEYKEKVTQKINPTQEKKLQDDIAQDRVTKNPPRDGQIIMTGMGQVICYDEPSDRYFYSDTEKIRRVQNDINLMVATTGSTPLSELYSALNLKDTPWADEVGWVRDSPLNIVFSAVITDKGEPCIVIDYQFVSIRGSNHLTSRGCDDDPPF